MATEVPPLTMFPMMPKTAKIAIVALMSTLTLIDAVFVPANVVVPILYPVAIAACLWTRSLSFLWSTAVVATVLALTLPHIGPPATVQNVLAIVMCNHLAAVMATLLVGLLVHHAIRTHAWADSQRVSMTLKRVQLEELNHELEQREEEIVRQNEELHSQTEELERQTEELRMSNEELASWEKRLEQLLELARNLTLETHRSDVLSKICETLGLVADTHSTALMERIGDEMVIHCHHGFGPDGAAADSIPFATSFSAKVMALGQTGYVEDIRLRPDLSIPQPKVGEPFRGVLATPLRADGKTIGTLEAYSTVPRAWMASEVSMIESVAIQAGKSIQAAELVERIRQERRRFEAAFRTVPFGMAVADDARGDQIRINPAAAALFHLPSDENLSPATPVGSRLQRHFSRGSEPVAPNELPIARSLRGEEVHAELIEFTPLKGNMLTLLTSSAPIFDGHGAIAGSVAAFVDITAQKVLENELDLRRREAEEASVRKTRFLAAVSHDIRTPANAINLMAELIRRLAGDPSRAKEMTEMSERLQANTHALMELVGDVLDVARFDTGKVELINSEFALAELIEQEIRQVQPLARDKGLELTFESTPRPVWLRTDRIKLGRIVGNLLGNAIKFTERGSVKISTDFEAEPERRLVIRVDDTGIGIPPANLSWIFDEFTQLHNPARDRAKGTGLGLAICHRLITLMGGTITVDSRVDEGSSFKINLPSSLVAMRTEVSPQAMREATAPPAAVTPLDLRILLVEDHSVTRDGTSRLLCDEGATVTEAPDGMTALNLLRQQEFDVLLLDMMLPDLDGREVLRMLQIQRPDKLRGVLVLTGDLTNDRQHETKALGADGVIAKPIDLTKLLQTLRSFM